VLSVLLKKIKASGIRDVKVEKVKAHAWVKIELAKMKQDTMRERARQEHKFQMAQMQLAGGHHGGPSFPNTTSFFSSMSAAAYSQSDHAGSSTVSEDPGSFHSATPDSSMGPFTQELNAPELSLDFYTSQNFSRDVE
jgi:hypothetical protein